MKVKLRLTRCEMLSVLPVSRLSMPMTSYPRSSRVSDRCEPMKPAAPVMTTRLFMSSQRRKRAAGDRSVRVLVEEAAQQREPHDLQIEANGPVLDVVEVVFDALVERRVSAPAVDL